MRGLTALSSLAAAEKETNNTYEHIHPHMPCFLTGMPWTLWQFKLHFAVGKTYTVLHAHIQSMEELMHN